ncbi:hypothetical protein VN12_00100 [Pirellula sp. SH-Sr6A]|uniref:hypothetical protein n=1 Tax=Pirellula sp. SH-Sr6A TaxID=1632865 RepID=UPI00078D9EA6|nr:hypothetical protein [Pirellula sp. SH-Sr6A]AMV30482.1 hypothetical protein VN12_00100 [Pirellula sp. SH-Sr6A]
MEKFKLGRWFHEMVGVRLGDFQFVAIPILAGSVVVPLLAWWLQRRHVISAGAQRMVEIVWLVLLILVSIIDWAMWAVDYCERIAEDLVTPFANGIFAGITISVLSISGIRQWRDNKCLAVKSLVTALILVATHCVMFYICTMAVGIVGVSLLIAGDSPLATFFLPDWFGQIVLLLAFALYLLIVAWAVPAIHHRLKIHQNADNIS